MRKIFAAVLCCILFALCAQDGFAAVALNAHNSSTATTSTAPTISVTTTGTNNIVVVCASIYSDTGVAQRTISSVSDVAGLTWTARGAGIGGNYNTNNQAFFQCFWALAAVALTADTVTVNLSGAPDTTAIFMTAWSGANTSTPFDPNASLPKYGSNLTGTGSDVTVSGVSTDTAAGAFALFTSDANIAGSLPTTAPSGFVNTGDFTSVSNSSTFNDGQSSTKVGALAAATVAFNPGTLVTARWLIIVDAIQPAAAASNAPMRSIIGVGK